MVKTSYIARKVAVSYMAGVEDEHGVGCFVLWKRLRVVAVLVSGSREWVTSLGIVPLL